MYQVNNSCVPASFAIYLFAVIFNFLGGGVEEGEESSNTAIREVLEEAGVVAQLHQRLGVFEV